MKEKWESKSISPSHLITSISEPLIFRNLKRKKRKKETPLDTQFIVLLRKTKYRIK